MLTTVAIIAERRKPRALTCVKPAAACSLWAITALSAHLPGRQTITPLLSERHTVPSSEAPRGRDFHSLLSGTGGTGSNRPATSRS